MANSPLIPLTATSINERPLSNSQVINIDPQHIKLVLPPPNGDITRGTSKLWYYDANKNQEITYTVTESENTIAGVAPTMQQVFIEQFNGHPTGLIGLIQTVDSQVSERQDAATLVYSLIYNMGETNHSTDAEILRCDYPLPIIGLNQSLNTFTVACNIPNTATLLTVAGSTGNNGVYTVVQVINNPTLHITVIIVLEAIVSAVVDGTVTFL